MNIHQVSVSYVQEQDRLLIRINGKEGGELRAWLTRRLALALLPVLHQTATDQMKKIAGPSEPAVNLEERRQQLLAAFKTEASLRSGDFETPYQDQQGQPEGLSLGPEPLMLTKVTVTLMGGGQLRLQLFEKLSARATLRNFELMMNAQLTNGLLHLLHQTLQRSQWLQAPPVPVDPELSANTDTEAAELSTDLAKPRYLN